MNLILTATLMNKIGVAFLFFILVSCGDNKWKANDPNSAETMNSGKMSVIVDESLSPILDSILKFYKKDYQKIILTDTFSNARGAMSGLYSGKYRAAIIARDYLTDEENILKENGAPKHIRVKAAIDGLVFIVNKNLEIKLTQDSIIKSIFQKGKKLSDFHPEIKSEIEFVVKERNSSEYSNFEKLILENKESKVKLNIKLTTKEVLEEVTNNKNSVGIVYLSQVAKLDSNVRFKLLPIGFADSLGRYITPKPVHQAYLVQNKYPYLVDWYIYLRDDKTDLAYWFASYVGKENKIQKYIKDMGIVPEFAKIVLKRSN